MIVVTAHDGGSDVWDGYFIGGDDGDGIDDGDLGIVEGPPY